MLSEDNQYLDYYQMQSPPFKWTGIYSQESDFYFLTSKLQKNVVVLYHFIDAREPLILITAEDGYGKSSTINYLNIILNREKNYQALLFELAPTKSSPDWFMQQLGYGLGLKEPYLLEEIIDGLMNFYINESKVILLIDNDKLFDLPLALENLRALMNIQPAGQHLFTAVLTATPEAVKQLETNTAFKSLISRRLDIPAFTVGETREYIEFNLSRVGRRNPLFSEQACAFIHDASHGIPLRINLLAQHALRYGAKFKKTLITDEVVLSVMPYFLEQEKAWEKELTAHSPSLPRSQSETLHDFLNTNYLKQLLLSSKSEEELVSQLDHVIAKCIFLSFLSTQTGLTDRLGAARYALSQKKVKDALNLLKEIKLT